MYSTFLTASFLVLQSEASIETRRTEVPKNKYQRMRRNRSWSYNKSCAEGSFGNFDDGGSGFCEACCETVAQRKEWRCPVVCNTGNLECLACNETCKMGVIPSGTTTDCVPAEEDHNGAKFIPLIFLPCWLVVCCFVFLCHRKGGWSGIGGGINGDNGGGGDGGGTDNGGGGDGGGGDGGGGGNGGGGGGN